MDSVCNKIPYWVIVSTGEIVEADSFDSEYKWDICCPYCREPIIYKGSYVRNKNWEKRKKHFSHRSKAVCVNKVSSEGESLEHKDSKDYIFRLLWKISSKYKEVEVITLKTEYPLQDESRWINRIADVYFEYKVDWTHYKQAYEIQYSNISQEELEERSWDYKKLWIQDIWLVWLQFKELNKKEKEDSEIYEDYQIHILWDPNVSYYFSDSDTKERFLIKRLINGDVYSKKIAPKSISLFKKVSKYQERVFFVSWDWISLPKVLNASFIGARSKEMYKPAYTFDIKDVISDTGFGIMNRTFHETFFWVSLARVEEIHSDYIYDLNLIYFKQWEIWKEFITDGITTLHMEYESEVKYKKEKEDFLKGKIHELQTIEHREKQIEEQKFSNNEYAAIYLTRLIARLVRDMNSYINNTKLSVARSKQDSLQWINKTLLMKNRNDNTVYWFFSSINAIIETMWHEVPGISYAHRTSLIASINAINEFLSQAPSWLYQELEYTKFYSEFSNALYRLRLPVDIYTRGTIDGLKDEEYRFWIKTCLQNYCLSQVWDIWKWDINLFMYKSLLRWSFSDMKESFKKEEELLTNIFNDINDNYL